MMIDRFKIDNTGVFYVDKERSNNMVMTPHRGMKTQCVLLSFTDASQKRSDVKTRCAQEVSKVVRALPERKVISDWHNYEATTFLVRWKIQKQMSQKI